jgi:ubiquitin-like protein ATG12
MPTSPPPPGDAAGIPDSDYPDNDLPLTLASSMILTSLPRDTATALRTAGEFPTSKITVRFVAIGSAPALRQKVCRISSAQRFEQVVSYLRRTLKVGPMDSVFLYVNSSFAPALDEIVGNLHGVSYVPLYMCAGCGRWKVKMC